VLLVTRAVAVKVTPVQRRGAAKSELLLRRDV